MSVKTTIFPAVTALLLITAAGVIVYDRQSEQRQEAEYEALAETGLIPVTEAIPPQEDIVVKPIENGRHDYTEAPQTPTQRYSVDFDSLVSINKDTVGWLRIPGTGINYPVVHGGQSTRYLSRNFYGSKSSAGTPFTYGSVDFNSPDQNITVFGHSFSNGSSMFSALKEYKSEDFYKKHSVLILCITADEKAQIVTLSTCDRQYGGKSGRLVVMGYKVGESSSSAY